jgi:hypothetical protein
MITILTEVEKLKSIENYKRDSDSFAAILCLRYLYIQHHARFLLAHQYAHSSKPDLELVSYCVGAAWRFFDVMDNLMERKELAFPNLVGFLHM